MSTGEKNTSYTVEQLQELFQFNIAERFPSAGEDAPKLNPPATDEDFEELEHTIGKRLPEEFKQLYRLYDGEEAHNCSCFFFGQEWLCISRIKEEWSCWNNLYKNGDLDDDFKPSSHHDPEVVQPVGFDPAWIPISYDGAGNHYMMDLNPGPKGTVGQIISYYHDSEDRDLLFPSILTCMGKCLNGIKDKTITYSPDMGWEDSSLFEAFEGEFEDGEGELQFGVFDAEGEGDLN